MTASTRRAALGAILAAPLAGGAVTASHSRATAAARPAASPELVRLIAKHDRINAILDCEADERDSTKPGTRRAAGMARARVTAFPSQSLADILAKAACLARLWPIAEAEEEVRDKAASGHVYIDCMALNIFVEVMKLGEGALCA